MKIGSDFQRINRIKMKRLLYTSIIICSLLSQVNSYLLLKELDYHEPDSTILAADSEDDLILPLNLSENGIIYDTVEHFSPPITIKTFNVFLQKNWIYFFYFEPYVPIVENFIIDTYCTTPSGRTYHFFDYNGNLENDGDTQEIYFEFGSAEGGMHEIEIVIESTSHLNIHLYLESLLPLHKYYNYNSYPTSLGTFVNTYDIHQYTQLNLEKEYQISIQEDTEYHFNFFQVNPISISDIINNGYVNPNVKLSIKIEDYEYEFYPSIPTLNYSLKSKIPIYDNTELNLLSSMFGDDSFLVKFGSHITGEAILTISLLGYSGFDLNFAFLEYYFDEIGDGPDNKDNNPTPPTNDNQTLLDDFLNQSNDDIKDTFGNSIERFIGNIEGFLDTNFWILMPILLVLGGICFSINKYLKINEIEKLKITERREKSE